MEVNLLLINMAENTTVDIAGGKAASAHVLGVDTTDVIVRINQNKTAGSAFPTEFTRLTSIAVHIGNKGAYTQTITIINKVRP